LSTGYVNSDFILSLRYKKRKNYIVALLSENFVPSGLEIALFGEHNREGLCVMYGD
jgi:hypothetical protein